MNCTDAQLDMQRRLDADSAEGARGFADLDEHLAACPACARVWLDLLAVRQRLTGLRADAPNPEEIDAMWQTVAATAPLELPAFRPPARAVILRFLGASAAVAACLLLAFVLGEQRYGATHSPSAQPRSQLSLRTVLSSDGAMSAGSNGIQLDALHGSAVGDGRMFQLGGGQPTAPQAGGSSAGLALLGFNLSTSSDDSAVMQLPTLHGAHEPALTSAEPNFERHGDFAGGFGGGGFGGGSFAGGANPFLAEDITLGLPLTRQNDADGLADAAGRTIVTRFGNPSNNRADNTFSDRDERFRNTVAGKSAVTTQAGTEYWSYGATTETNQGGLRAGDAMVSAGTPITTVEGTNLSATDQAKADFTRNWNVEKLQERAANDNALRYNISPTQSEATRNPLEPSSTTGKSVKIVVQDGSIRATNPQDQALLDQISSQTTLEDGRPARSDRQLADAEAGPERADLNSPAVDAYDTDIVLHHGNTQDAGARAEQTGEQPAGDAAQPAAGTSQPQGAQVTTAAPKPPRARIIKTGTLATEVEDYEQAVQQVNAILERFDCFLADASTREMAGGALTGELTIRVAPGDFEGLFAALRQVGRLESEDVKAADVTAQYVDLEARIAALKLTEARLVELVKSKTFVDRMDDLLKVEQELNRVRTDIEQLEGQLRVLADRVALSTITLQLHERGRVVPSASLFVEVHELAAASDALTAALTQLGGRLVSGKINERDGGALGGDYRVKINLDHFADAIAAIAALGRVESREVRDFSAAGAAEPWAARVPCDIALTLFERARDLPTGSLALQIPNLGDAVAALEDAIAPVGAAIAANRTTQRDDGSASADVQLRVPAGAFAALVDRVATLGRVTAKQITGETGAIVGGAADTPCTLALTLAEPQRQIPSGGMVIEVAKFAPARDRLAKLVTDRNIQVLASSSSQRTDGTWVGRFNLGITASAMDAAVSELEKLGEVSQREIRGIGLGELSRIDPNALGVIQVVLAEKAALTPEPDRAGGSFRKYLRDGLAGLYESLGLIVYGLVVLAPWLVIALGAGWLITRAWKRRRALETEPRP